MTSKAKEQKEWGVEILIEHTIAGTVHVGARQCNIDDTTIEKEMNNADAASGSGEVASMEAPTHNNADAVLVDTRLEVPATDNNADAVADASLAGVVASMEAPPADNNADAANADAVALALEAPADNDADALADASDVALEFDRHSVSIFEFSWIQLYYEFIYYMNSLIYEFT